MIVDTSAIVVILRDEPEARSFADAIAGADSRRVSRSISSKRQQSLTQVGIP
jgi:uncharacterized protein with PIN domain